ncbi:MAG: asparagine synthase-related protein [Novosphingobium sp.]
MRQDQSSSDVLTPPRDDLLILAAIDLSDGPDWFAEDWERALRALALGKAGDVLHGRLPGAAFATRAETSPGPMRPVRQRTHGFRRQADGSYVLLAGRLHHVGELEARFGLPRHPDHASLYSALHAKLGDDCDKRIAGDYAVVQWWPDQRKVRLARSPVAHAPLHVMRDGTKLVVSSVPGPILALGHRTRIDDARIGGWLLSGWGPPDRSFYEGMTCLACGTREVHDHEGRKTARYWSLRDVPDVRFKRDEEYVEAVEEQLRRATEAMLGTARSPGVMLSGGFDSQAVASFAVGQLGSQGSLRSYTSIPANGYVPGTRTMSFGDEAEHVRDLCAMYPQIQPTFIQAADMRFGERLNALMLVSGWPMYNETNSHWFHAGLERAAADGVDVMLTGDSGNAGFSYDGWTGFATWLAEGKWLRLVRELKAFPFDDRPMWRKLVSRAVMPHVPLSLKRRIDAGRGWRGSPFATWSPLREDWAHNSGLLDEVGDDGFTLYDYDVATSREWRDRIVTRSSNGGSEILLGFELLYGVPIRDVHAYAPLLELCAGIPDEQYLRDGQDRWLGRRVLAGRVPERVWKELRMGRQAADWPMRMQRDRDAMLEELESLSRDERIAEVIDFPRLIKSLREWDGQDRPERRDSTQLVAALGRGLSTARFIRFAEGRNVS